MKYLAVVAVLCLGVGICSAQNAVVGPWNNYGNLTVSGNATGYTGSTVNPYTQPAPKKPSFITPANITLFTVDLGVRLADAYTTRQFMTDPCHCYYEKMLPPVIVQSNASMYSYSIGSAVVLGGISYLLYRSGHHKLAHLVPTLDIGFTGDTAFSNHEMLQ